MSDQEKPTPRRLVRGVWVTVAAAATIAWFAGPISQWSQLQAVCQSRSACPPFQLNKAAVRTLTQHGLGLRAYAIYVAAALTLVWIIWYGLGALIIWRRPDDRGALLGAFFLAIFPIWEVSAWVTNSTLSAWMGALFTTALLVFALLFPDGTFRPRWTRWLALFVVFENVATTLPLPSALQGPVTGLFMLTFAAVIVMQIYRFRSLSNWREQQQTKWALVGIGTAVLGVIAIFLPSFLTSNGSLYSSLTTTTGIAFVVTAIPISITIALLRSRLWDIDRVISRALAYATLTVTIGGVYVGGVIGLQALIGLVAGNSSGPAIVLSTLAIAALFGPLRRRIQVGIDRRFYRSKYDAVRTVAALGERLRNEVELGQLSHDLTSVVHEALQPSHVSLWLREGANNMPVDGR